MNKQELLDSNNKIKLQNSNLLETLRHVLTVYSMVGGDEAERMVKMIVREQIRDIEQECYK
jgi:hypothetical protein